MNSNSRYIEDNCKRDRRDDDNRRRPQAAATLKCSAPGAVTIPALDAPGSTFTPASLTVRTSGFCNPCTKLEFTSNITLPALFAGTVSFQIFKQCRNQTTPVPVGPAFIFSRTVAVDLGESNTFSFFVCDCDDDCFDDSDCCTYSVVITNQSLLTLGLTITNATLSALTANQNNRCC
ncbi:MAG: DUF4489 domain-containing protein [Tissierellia bacterium]|nr:DUF4489 domain-containing protein [Tissierellia bacterium]